MADKLTPQQEQAVLDRGGKLLVSAAAGSGKTKVLVDRLMRCLTDPQNPANLDEFLIITYTKAAAAELRGKIADKLTQRIAEDPENRHLQKQLQRLYLTQISTVHSFCSNILREYAYHIDLAPDFRVADEGECEELRESVLKELLDRAYEKTEDENHFRDFVDTQGVGRNDSSVPEIIQKVFDSARCHLDPQGWLDQCLSNIRTEQTEDASQSVWGRFLMDDLFSWLDRQIDVMRTCRDLLVQSEGEGKRSQNLAQTVEQLEYLRASATWDEVHSRRDVQFGTLSRAGKNADPDTTERVKAIRTACKDELPKRVRCFANDSAQTMEDLRQSGAAAEGLIALVRQFDREYSRAKRSRRVLDFGDLEHRTLDLLLGKNRSGITAAAVEIGSRFREIMVDEYQDSNGVQDAIFSALTEKRQNCFMVGDVKQSIYQFRLADPQIFLDKYKSYADADSASDGQGRKVLLSHNFRSGAEVISGINDVFRACMSQEVGGLEYGDAEALREGVPHIPLPDPAVELYALEVSGDDSYEEEAAFTASRIRQMLDSGMVVREKDALRPMIPEDIVILLRSPNSVGRNFQQALEAEGIRCAMDGAGDLMQTEEVSTFRAFLQTIANPQQDIPLLTVLASPVFGFTADELAQIRAGNKHVSFYDALTASTMPRAAAFLQTLEALRAKSGLETLTELMQSCLLLTRMDSIYAACPGGRARQENIRMFYRLAADYENTGLKTLDQFLEYLDNMRSSVMASGSSSAGCVKIMSIHKSKGLEFPVVFLCGLSRKFNRESLYDTVLCDKDLGLGLAVADNRNRVRYSSISKRAIAAAMKADSLSEEMRVLYVAMTRAKDRLIMTCTMRKAAEKLQDIALRLSADGGKLLCLEADKPSEWILTAAMQRMEAGELHALGGRPEQLKISDYPWKIAHIETTAPVQKASAIAQSAAAFPAEAVDELKEGLAFRYPYEAATQTPSKQTATGRKGRIRDEEAAENTRPKQPRALRKPSFREAVRSGTAYGNAIHSAMQFVRYEACRSEAGAAEEIHRLVEQGYLTEEEGHVVKPSVIAAFFVSEPGRMLCSGAEYIREFKFSILDDAGKYGDGLEGEHVLLQGVVDCAILEEDGITVLDFKTDRVTEETLSQTADRYRLQLETYSDAITRIFERPVKKRLLYFFHLNRFVEI